MKRLCGMVLILTFVVCAAFADRSRFYPKDELVDTMFVDSEDGLKVRDKPSLKGRRLCGLEYGMVVKIIAVGNEETINGITDPWVKIVLPKREWKSEEPEYGWVFGGYLGRQKYAVNFDGDSRTDVVECLVNNPWRIQIEYDEFAVLRFYRNGKAVIYHWGREYCKFNYYVLDGKKIRIEIPLRQVISEWPRLCLGDGSIDPNGFLDERSVHSGIFDISFIGDSDDASMTISGCALHGSIADCDFASQQEYRRDNDYWDAVF